MRSYFYGIKVQLVTTGEGIPIAFHFTVVKTADVKALDKITEIFPPEARLYGIVLIQIIKWKIIYLKINLLNEI